MIRHDKTAVRHFEGIATSNPDNDISRAIAQGTTTKDLTDLERSYQRERNAARRAQLKKAAEVINSSIDGRIASVQVSIAGIPDPKNQRRQEYERELRELLGRQRTGRNVNNRMT
jgi:hypothetical protein